MLSSSFKGRVFFFGFFLLTTCPLNNILFSVFLITFSDEHLSLVSIKKKNFKVYFVCEDQSIQTNVNTKCSF